MTTNKQPTTRRTVLGGAAAAAGLGLAATACAGSPEEGEQGAGQNSAAPTAPVVALGPSSDVPVGGAKLFREQKVIVAQPSEGTFEGVSAVCTHRGCVLDKVENDEGNCACHGSRFSVTTGKVLQGPATKPLPRVRVTEKDGRLVAGPEPKGKS